MRVQSSPDVLHDDFTAQAPLLRLLGNSSIMYCSDQYKALSISSMIDILYGIQEDVQSDHRSGLAPVAAALGLLDYHDVAHGIQDVMDPVSFEFGYSIYGDENIGMIDQTTWLGSLSVVGVGHIAAQVVKGQYAFSGKREKSRKTIASLDDPKGAIELANDLRATLVEHSDAPEDFGLVVSQYKQLANPQSVAFSGLAHRLFHSGNKNVSIEPDAEVLVHFGAAQDWT
jgi:hypothetical protein